MRADLLLQPGNNGRLCGWDLIRRSPDDRALAGRSLRCENGKLAACPEGASAGSADAMAALLRQLFGPDASDQSHHIGVGQGRGESIFKLCADQALQHLGLGRHRTKKAGFIAYGQ